MPADRVRQALGDLLMDRGMVSPEQLAQALTEQKRTGEFRKQVPGTEGTGNGWAAAPGR